MANINANSMNAVIVNSLARHAAVLIYAGLVIYSQLDLIYG